MITKNSNEGDDMLGLNLRRIVECVLIFEDLNPIAINGIWLKHITIQDLDTIR